MGADPVSDLDDLIARLHASAGAHDTPSGGGTTEAVDLLAHALQCAHELVLTDPDDVELQVAGLVHDLGHLLVPGDDAGHGVAGARAVRPLLGDRVADLVEMHVPAKRYLVATDAAYASLLSPVSVRTMTRQGGSMSLDEIAAFERRPDHEAAVLLRRADDAAKIPGRPVPGLEAWIPVLERLATR